MITIKELIKELEKYPANAEIYAYQGEKDGIVIVKKKGKVYDQIGFIKAPEDWGK